MQSNYFSSNNAHMVILHFKNYSLILFIVLMSLIFMTNIPATAETIEEIPVEALEIKKSSISIDELDGNNADPTSFGVALQTLILIDERLEGNEIQDRSDKTGVDLRGIGDLENKDDLQEELSLYLSTPLSFELIENIKQKIIDHYRQNHLKLISVNIPPQEISDGGLQFNILPFVLNDVFFTGNNTYSSEYLSSNIRLQSGQSIDINEFKSDLDWLAQNPFRSIQARLKAGKDYGTTDVILDVVESRPYSYFVGAANTGTNATHKDRIYGGVTVANLVSTDDTLTYSAMLNSNSLGESNILEVKDEKGFVSHNLIYTKPLNLDGTRSMLGLVVQQVSTISQNRSTSNIQQKSMIHNYSAELAFPQQVLSQSIQLIPEIYLGIEVKKSDQDTLINYNKINNTHIKDEVIQIPVGLRGSTSGTLFGFKSQGSIDASITIGEGERNGVKGDTYNYFGYTLNQQLLLTSDLILGMRSSGQYTNETLPSLIHSGIGGAGSVRGYESNEYSSESAVMINLELKKLNPRKNFGSYVLKTSPFGFTDAGYISQLGTSDHKFISSAGFGLDIELNRSTSLKATVARSFHAGQITEKDSSSLHLQIVSRF